MDVATIIGILAAWGSLALAAAIGHVDVSIIFARYEAFLLVFGGSIGATMVSFPVKTLVQGLAALRFVFGAARLEERETIATLVAFAEKARREGLLALENEANELQDDFMRKGIQLVIDGRDTDIIRKILETEVGYVEQRFKKAESVWMTMGGYSPTLGIIGTVTFANDGGLQRIGSNQFASTANSGLPMIGAANTGNTGAIVSGALEQSNVSLADQFTKMIVTQNAFTANSRTIATSDQMEQTVVNLLPGTG